LGPSGDLQLTRSRCTGAGVNTQQPTSNAGGQGAASGQAPAIAFLETGQSLQGRFLSYWRANGGLSIFGYPISPQDGAPLAQVFERARFEYHPENPAPYDVLLGRLGSALYGEAR
jgi:hypothetical protein